VTRTALPHLEESLRRGLDLLQEKLLEMATRAEQAHWDALDALKRMDRQAAYLVIFRDQHIDRLETELDRLCIEFLVRQQPAGRHLRFVFSVVKITKELERVGDYAESVARQVLNLAVAPAPELVARLEQLAGISLPMFKQAVQAFLESDPSLARSLIHEEIRADRVRRDFDCEVTALCRIQKVPTDAYAPLLTVARRLERVSDQARNICEETLYASVGEYVKHQDSGVFNVLFVDDDTATRAALAERIAGKLQIPGFTFHGVGVQTAPLDVAVATFMRDKGLDVQGYRGQTMSSLDATVDPHVVVVLSSGVKDVVDQQFRRSLIIEWRIPPVAGQVPACEEACRIIEGHVRDLVAAIQGSRKETISDV